MSYDNQTPARQLSRHIGPPSSIRLGVSQIVQLIVGDVTERENWGERHVEE
jgi:hypothetical protein